MIFASQPFVLFPGLANLDETVSFYQSRALADSTFQAKRCQWRKYYKFCVLYDLTPLPSDTNQVCRYLVHLTKSLQYSSINNYLSGLILLHNLYGLPYDFRSDLQVLFMLQGIKHELGNPTRRKDPLIPCDLKRIHSLVDQSDPIERAVWACIVFGFRSLLRIFNLLPDKGNIHCLKRGDITFQKWGLCAHLKSSKTIQNRERVVDIPISSAPGSLLDAVELLRLHFQETQPFSHSDYLFMIPSSKGYSPLTYNRALPYLKRWAAKACPNKDIAFHSLRRGCATHMSSSGISLENIKAAGDWASMAVLMYLSSPLSHRINVDNFLVSTLY